MRPILGCHKPVDGSFRCECGWPMCSKECCLSFIHKGIYEHGLTILESNNVVEKEGETFQKWAFSLAFEKMVIAIPRIALYIQRLPFEMGLLFFILVLKLESILRQSLALQFAVMETLQEVVKVLVYKFCKLKSF